jgi:phage/plasmid-associated DNA primase
VIEEFRRQSSPITEFADEYCNFDAEKTIPGAMIYDAYVKWCKEQGAIAGTQTRFMQRFRLLYPGCLVDRFMFTGKQVRGFKGVTLTEEAIERYLIGGRR